MNRHANPLLAKELGVGKLTVGEHLLLILVLDVGVKIARSLLGRFKRSDADALVGEGAVFKWCQGRVEVNKGRGHLSPVAELESTLAKAASGYHRDGVGGATVDLDEGDEALAIGGARFGDTKPLTPEHSEADTEDLSGAEVAVGEFGLVEEIGNRLHETMIIP